MAIEPRWCLVVAANVDIRLLQKCTRLSVHVSMWITWCRRIALLRGCTQNFGIIASGPQQQVIIYIF